MIINSDIKHEGATMFAISHLKKPGNHKEKTPLVGMVANTSTKNLDALSELGIHLDGTIMVDVRMW